MNTVGSVYPSAVADKCIALLREKCSLMDHPEKSLSAARFLMMHGLVEVPGRTPICFAVLSPDTPRFYYQVNMQAEACTCEFFLRTQRPCKHLYAVVLTLLAQRQFGYRPSAVPQKARGR